MYKASEVWESEMPPLLTEPDLLLSKGMRQAGKKCEAHLVITLLRCRDENSLQCINAYGPDIYLDLEVKTVSQIKGLWVKALW